MTPPPPTAPVPAFDEHAVRVLEARYLRRDETGKVVETPAEMLWRVARAVAAVEGRHGGDAEAWARRFYATLARLEFLPNSPTLMNAGRNRGQLSACFVLPVEDELEAIFDTVKHAARIHQTGGGTGFSFSRLRPRHARLSSGGEASGPVSFMKVFDAATAAVYQGGVRRGANMGILRVDHPDILEFIDAKRDLTQLTHFNISVAATDAFMQALEKGTTYDLLDPQTGAKAGEEDARRVWDRIVRSAWATGDPGLVFIDRINALHPTPELGNIESTNPCVPGDTWVLTDEGPRQVEELVGKPVTVIVNGQPFATAEGFFPTGTKPVFEVVTREGHSLRATEDHEVRRADGSWVAVRDLRAGDRLALHDHRSLQGWDGPDLPIADGTTWSDGDLTDATHLVEALLGSASAPTLPPAPSQGDRLRAFAPIVAALEAQLQPPSHAVERTSARFQRRFLARRLVEATVEADGSARLVVHAAMRSVVQRMLLRLGVPSLERHDALMLEPAATRRCAEVLGLGDLAMKAQHAAPLHADAFAATVSEVRAIGEQPVYDVRVPGPNAFDADGFYVANCGELPLLPYESCNLGSVDLHKHLLPDGSDLDWPRLSETVRLGVRFLDDVIDANTYPMEEIDRITHTNRKVGLGVMGWADTLIALGIPYDTQRALDLGGRVMAFVLQEARAESRALAKERGAFPAFRGSRHEQRGEAPLRNATVTTVAPTGTIALLAGCSSGIEPLYAVAYVRRALDGQARLELFHPLLERVARARGGWSEALRERALATGSLEGAPGVPDAVRALFRTAHEIAPEWHVRMQAAFQAHCENAVSKTANLPRDARPDDVSAIYQLAYRTGCKGITIYRDGSREGQVLSTRQDPVEPSPLPPASCPECAPTDAGDVP